MSSVEMYSIEEIFVGTNIAVMQHNGSSSTVTYLENNETNDMPNGKECGKVRKNRANSKTDKVRTRCEPCGENVRSDAPYIDKRENNSKE